MEKHYQYNICEEFDCDEEYCLRETGKKCSGFDNEDCLFYSAHRQLNLKKDLK